jgi:hypothetical protein
VKKIYFYIVIFSLALQSDLYSQLVPNLGGQRAGISAFQFLKIGVGARAIGLGESYVAVANDVSALYWNPAGLAQFNDNQIMVSHTEYVVDIKHEFFGIAYHFTEQDAFGASIIALHMKDMEITTETQPVGTGRYFTFRDIAAGLTYSRKMTDQFSFGISVKYVEETLDVLKMRSVMVDLGTYYWTGLGTSRFAVVVSNFGSDVAPHGDVKLLSGTTVNTFQSFSPPTLFKIGFATEPVEMEDQRLTTSIELHHPNDNAENVHLGVEYGWHRWLSLRAGVKRTIGEPLLGKDNTSSNDYTIGVGISSPLEFTTLTFDYAYANFNLLGSVHRFSLALTY